MTDDEINEFLSRSYEGLLSRPIDSVGQQDYFTALKAGTLTPADVLRRIMESKEYSTLKRKLDEETERFLRLAYQGLLGRPIDMVGFPHYFAGLRQGIYTPSEILSHIVESDEYKGKQLVGIDYTPSLDPEWSSWLTAEIRSDTEALRRYAPRGLADFVDASARVVDVRSVYFVEHKIRFLEMINAIEFLKSRLAYLLRPVRLLEFGGDHTVRMLKANLSQGFQLYNADIRRSASLAGILEDQFELDLERDLREDAKLGGVGFDVITFCEVIEHLRANPVRLLRFLRANLERNGFLYLTTPNFYRRAYVLAFWTRNRMQPIVPADMPYEQLYAHHVHEYCAKELWKYATEAGLKVAGFYFSSCWDEPAASQAELEDQLANLVFVLQRDDAQRGLDSKAHRGQETRDQHGAGRSVD